MSISQIFAELHTVELRPLRMLFGYVPIYITNTRHRELCRAGRPSTMLESLLFPPRTSRLVHRCIVLFFNVLRTSGLHNFLWLSPEAFRFCTHYLQRSLVVSIVSASSMLAHVCIWYFCLHVCLAQDTLFRSGVRMFTFLACLPSKHPSSISYTLPFSILSSFYRSCFFAY